MSRAKAQSIREAVAITPIAAAAISSMTIHVITVAPPVLFVAWRKISINGNPVGVARASSILPRQKRTAIYNIVRLIINSQEAIHTSIANPRTPFRSNENIITFGTTVDALWISSLMWHAESAPRKAKTPVTIPTNQESPSEDHSPPLTNVTKTSFADP